MDFLCWQGLFGLGKRIRGGCAVLKQVLAFAKVIPVGLGLGLKLGVRHWISQDLTSREGGGEARDHDLFGGGVVIIWGVPTGWSAPFAVGGWLRAGKDAKRR